MSRMNSKTRTRLYPILVSTDGDYCAKCGRVGLNRSLCVDHIDNNNNNNDLDNLQLLCRSCNAKKNPRGKAKPQNPSTELYDLHQSEELRLKKVYQPKFIAYLESQVTRYKRVPMKDFIYSCAKITGASKKTMTDYLNVECSTAGSYQIVETDGQKYVELKFEFHAASKSELRGE